jgi:hypothetical protein
MCVNVDRATSTAKAVFNLTSLFKWCLTGTPLQNRVGELYRYYFALNQCLFVQLRFVTLFAVLDSAWCASCVWIPAHITTASSRAAHARACITGLFSAPIGLLTKVSLLMFGCWRCCPGTSKDAVMSVTTLQCTISATLTNIS